MNDEWQFGAPGRLYVDAKALPLDIPGFGRVVVVEPGLPDSDELGMGGQSHQFLDARQRLFECVHRMGTGGVVN